MEIINCKALAEQIYAEIKEHLSELQISPRIAIIIASDNEASKTYVKLKMAKATEVGINAELIEFSKETNSEEIIKRIEELNSDNRVTGIMVQLPLYPSLEPARDDIVNAIDPLKDIDGLTSFHLGMLSLKDDDFKTPPATVDAIFEVIQKQISIEALKNKQVLIINDSNLIGKPLSLLLGAYNPTITIANKFTQNIKNISLQGDIIISATGQGELFDHSYFNDTALVIDVTSIRKDNRTVGDVIITPQLESKNIKLTPVPGGIGPLTIACLLRNAVRLAELQSS